MRHKGAQDARRSKLFSKLAREGTAVVVPGNVGDLAGMIANALAVYGKVNEGQAKSIAAKVIGVEGQSEPRRERKDTEGDAKLEQEQESMTGQERVKGEVAENMLAGFDQTREQR